MHCPTSDAIFWWGTLVPLYPVGREGKSSFGYEVIADSFAQWLNRFSRTHDDSTRAAFVIRAFPILDLACGP